MNLSASLGLQIPIAPAAEDHFPTIDLTMRFVLWAEKLDSFPTPAQIRAEFGVSKRSSIRWRQAYARAKGIAPPPIHSWLLRPEHL